MNYFDFHIGDYQRKTAHLTIIQHGAYTLMIQHFLQTERPLPADRKTLYRVLRAETVADKQAIDSIAKEFWRSDGKGGLINKRAQEVIDAYQEWVGQQKANGSRGGRPKKTDGLSHENPSLSHENPSLSKTETQTKPNGGDRARSHFPPPTSHPPSPSTHTPNPPLQSRARANGSNAEEQGSVCEIENGQEPEAEAAHAGH